MVTPDLSIIIVNWNTRELLRGCLASLPAATGSLVSEIIVVDNGSSDGSSAMVRDAFPGVRLEEPGKNLGFARANNRAIELTTGRAVLLLNPDTVCPPDSLARLLAAADARPGCGGVGPLLIDTGGAPTITCGNFPSLRHHLARPLAQLPLGRRWERWVKFTHIPRRDEPDHPVDYVAGACLLIPRAALESVGLLDERFFLYFEETDWCRRAWQAGRPIILCNTVEVVHLEGKAAELVSHFSLQQFHHSYRHYLDKHTGPASVVALRAALIWEKSLQWLVHAVRPWSPRNRKLAARAAFELSLQFQKNIAPQPPTTPT